MENRFVIPFAELSLKDLPLVGGKNASLGEMIQRLKPKGILVPDGFAVSALAYWAVLDENGIRDKLSSILEKLDSKNYKNLGEISSQAKRLVFEAEVPQKIIDQILDAYWKMSDQEDYDIEVAVRSSATAEDLPTASFAGQQESFLNISGKDALIIACRRCFASLFTERAIKYRIDNGFKHMDVALSIGIQRMVRSDKSCSGVAFTLEPETGFRSVVVIDGIWGLGENIVQGVVDPDEFIVFKEALRKGKKAILSKKKGKKQVTMIYSKDLKGKATKNIKTPIKLQNQFILEDDEIEKLAEWSLIIEDHYKTPMDIEWAKDFYSQQLYIVQARPETVHSSNKTNVIYTYVLKEKGRALASGISLGDKIATGKARILKHPKESGKLKKGEVLVTDITNPDWDPIMKKAAAIITNKGGRTSHAAIVARELGVVAVVGTGNATEMIKDGQEITVSCVEKVGFIYAGLLKWEKLEIDISQIKLPKTEVMYILADPDQAFRLSMLPNNGIGLMRMEFVINNHIQIHPMALVSYSKLKDKKAKQVIKDLTSDYPDKKEYFVEKLSLSIAMAAAAFYPKDVIVRMSDFKTNEYANLIGGTEFEPKEENPMLGFRGASRYYHDLYKEGFRLECEAMKRVRDDMGLTNVKLMIPFCRTIEEGKKVIKIMEEYGLKSGKNGLEIYTMIEIPSNVILADQFAKIFDGFSIGSNDLTQLTLGLDRDSTLVSNLFDENNQAVKELITSVIKSAKENGIKIGLCGQAPSDFPEFAEFLVQQGIDSISFNPDALIRGIENINKAEKGK